MVPNFCPTAMPLVTRGAALFPLLLLSCMVLSTLADSLPSFVKIPEDQTGVSGGVASFMCQATGEPKPRITWSKNGKKISSQRFEVIEFDDGSGSVLRIQPLRLHRDKVIFECTASNSVGEINTSAQLTVLEEGQILHDTSTINMGLKVRVVDTNQTTVILCTASGIPDSKISWFKDMQPVKINDSNGRIRQLPSGTLVIGNTEESDKGKYECMATTNDGIHIASTARLYVQVRLVPPRFLIRPLDQEVMSGESVNLTCVAVGSPMPYVKWIMGMEELTREDEIPLERNVLEVTNIRESANYTCVAMSSLGMINTTAQVTVKTLLKPPTSLTVTETTATSVTLSWDSGNAVSYIIQYRVKASDNGFQEIEGVTTTRYSIWGLSPYSKYQFRVMAVNSIGRGPPSDAVETQTGEQAPSSPPLNVHAHLLSPSTMLVRWELPVKTNGLILGYRIYYSADLTAFLSEWKKINTVEKGILISNLIPNTTYSLRVLGFTSVGDGPLSDILQVKTMQRALPKPLTSLTVSETTATSVTLTWDSGNTKPVSYVIHYKAKTSDNSFQEEEGVATTRYTIGGLRPYSEYQFRVRAVNNIGRGPPSNTVETRTGEQAPSSPPLNVQARMLNPSTTLVQWEPPEEPNGLILGYRVYYSADLTAPLSAWQKRNTDDSSLTAISGLIPDITYSLRVLAFTSVGDGPLSNILQVNMQQEELPKPPTSLTVTETTATSVTLTWDSGNIGPVSYIIQYKAKDSDIDFQEVEGVATNSYNIGGLRPYSGYYFSVMAVNSIGRGPPSDPVETRTREQAPSSPPLHVQARMLSASALLVQWEPPEEPNGLILGYRVYYNVDLTAPLSAWQKRNTDDSSFTAISGLIPNTTYSLKVLGFTSAGDGPLSDILEVNTHQRVPAQPSSFDAEAEQDDRIMLTWLWPVQEPITKYELQYWEAGSETKIHKVIEPANSYVVVGLKPDTLYSFILAARSEVGLGVYTQPIEAHTAQTMTAAPPRKLEVEALNSTAIRVTWKPPLQQKQHGQIRGYQVIFSRLENGEPRGQPNIMDVALPEAQEAIIGGLHSETTYSVTVAAYTAKGDGARSKAKVVTTSGAVPGKPLMMINITMENTVLIEWQPPKEMVGDLIGYQLQYKRTDDENFTSRELRSTDDHYTVTGLHKGATYIFRLSARNLAGIGEACTEEISTPEDIPAGFPTNLQVRGLTQSSMQLTWEPPLLAERNGKIISYMVKYRDINSQTAILTYRTTKTYLTIQDLRPDTTYDITVQAYTSNGWGPPSPSIHGRTVTSP